MSSAGRHGNSDLAKFCGPAGSIEPRREVGHSWYGNGFVLVTLSCVALVVVTWLVMHDLFVWKD